MSNWISSLPSSKSGRSRTAERCTWIGTGVRQDRATIASVAVATQMHASAFRVRKEIYGGLT